MYTDPTPTPEPTLDDVDFKTIDALHALKIKFDNDINAVHSDMQSRTLDEATKLGNPMAYFDRLYNEGKQRAERAFLDAAWKVTWPADIARVETALRNRIADMHAQTPPTTRETLRLWETRLSTLSWARGMMVADVDPEQLRQIQRERYTNGVGRRII